MSDYLPFEIQVEIIKKLPIKSLIQFRSVSKAWKSVIESSDFIADYTLHNPTQQQHLLIRYNNLYSEEIYVSIVDDDSFPQNKCSPTVPRSVNLLSYSSVVGTSHGLICLVGYYQNEGDVGYNYGTPMAVLWNPSIRKSVAIAVPYADWPAVTAFGVCPATSDPKIVRINYTRTHKKMKSVTCSSSRWQVEVFSLKSGVWRSSIGNLSDELFDIKWSDSQVIIDGSIYWFGTKTSTNDTKYQILITFDLSSEEFGEIYLPNELAIHDEMDLYLLKLRDSLVVLQQFVFGNDVYEVWMMDNGDSKTFTKLFRISVPDISSVPLEFTRNGKLMITITHGTEALVYYNPFSEHINDLGIEGQRDSSLVNSYTESLILLDQKNTLADDEDDEENRV